MTEENEEVEEEVEEQEPTVIAGKPVEVGSLEPGQLFTLDRKQYIISAVYPFGVMAVPAKPSKQRKLVEKLPTDTLVKPA